MKFIPEIITQEISINTDEISLEDILFKIDFDDYISLVDLLSEQKEVTSKGEAKRLIQQGGIKVDGEKISDSETYLRINNIEPYLIQIGKRRFCKYKLRR